MKRSVLVITNPHSGSSNPDLAAQTVQAVFVPLKWDVSVHRLSRRDNIKKIMSGKKGLSLIIASGGDGTISEVADALVGSTIPLGILPAGTANVLAHELQIPFDWTKACELYAGTPAVRVFDAMKIGSQHYFLDVSCGVKSEAINDTKRASKKTFGMLAYLWNGLRWMMKMRRRRYTITVDGVRHDIKASEVDIANGSIMGQSLFTYGAHVHPDDGVLNVCIVKTARLKKYLKVFLHLLKVISTTSDDVFYYDASHRIRIETEKPIPVQADGEMIGKTPITIDVVPGAVRFLAPETTEA